jgi:hypothetical protein
MAEESVVIKKRDFAEIVKLQDPGLLAQFFDEPRQAIAESITGALSRGPQAWIAATGRIVQGVLKAQLIPQVASEIKRLREEGKIRDDYAETKYGFQTWVELFSVIDEETPDEDRLEALKSMFFAVNRVGVSDREQIVAYQLWQIAKRLNSGELLVLRAAHEVHKNSLLTPHSNHTFFTWSQIIGNAAGLPTGMVTCYEPRLEEFELLTPRYGDNRQGINPEQARLSDLGMRLCTNIETYKIVSQQPAE